MAHLVFLPEEERPCFFLWGAASAFAATATARAGVGGAVQALLASGEPREARLAGPTGGVARRKGVGVGLLKGVGVLAAVPMEQVGRLPGSLGAWCAASKLALELASRGRFAPRVRLKEEAVVPRGLTCEARWEVSLVDRRDAERFEGIARAMPRAAHAVPLDTAPAGSEPGALRKAKGKVTTVKRPGAGERKAPSLWPGDALLHCFLSAAIDALVREAVALRVGSVGSAEGAEDGANRSKCLQTRVDLSIPWELRLVHALVSDCGEVDFAVPAEEGLIAELQAWCAPAFVAAERGARDGAGERDGAEEGAGGEEEDRVRVRMRLGVGPGGSARDRAGGADRLDMSGALRFRWEVALDGAALRAEQARAFLEQGRVPAPRSGALEGAASARLEGALRLVAQGSGILPARAALRALLAGSVAWPGLPGRAEVVAEGSLGAAMGGLVSEGLVGEGLVGEGLTGDGLAGEGPVNERPVREGPAMDGTAGAGEGKRRRAPELPEWLTEMRSPKLERELAWLARRVSLGLGGCLVDEDTAARKLSVIALLLHLAKTRPARARRLAETPPLVITADPAAWEAAVAQAAPPLVPALHCGSERAQGAAALKVRAAGRGVVLAGYAELELDEDILGALDWPLIVFDEPDAKVISAAMPLDAAQRLRARCRIALAGAPMDRSMASIWVMTELVSPGLLGSMETFRRELAVPIERFRDPEAAALLARLVRLFVFRGDESASGAVAVLPAGGDGARREEVGG